MKEQKMSRRKKILCVFGTRPEAIKMAPLILKLQNHPSKFQAKVVLTGQHKELLDHGLSLFGIRSFYNLDVMKKSQSLTVLSKAVLGGLSSVYQKEKPDMVLVHGDTSTTLFASLAAYYQKIPIGHVEAGLRSKDIYNPFPEEVNRKLTDALATLCFAPTPQARKNLMGEGVSSRKIIVTGNTGIDALFLGKEKVEKFLLGNRKVLWGNKIKNLHKKYSQEKFVLITVHRRENWGKPLNRIFQGLKKAAMAFPSVSFVYPVHPNPAVKDRATSFFKNVRNVHLLKPLPYAEFIFLLMNCHFVITDSGGLQEEAPSLGKPVLVLRNVTERPEAVRAGTVRLVGSDVDKIQGEIARLLTNKTLYQKMSQSLNPYGDGRAAERTVKSLFHFFKFTSIKPSFFNPR